MQVVGGYLGYVGYFCLAAGIALACDVEVRAQRHAPVSALLTRQVRGMQVTPSRGRPLPASCRMRGLYTSPPQQAKRLHVRAAAQTGSQMLALLSTANMITVSCTCTLPAVQPYLARMFPGRPHLRQHDVLE